MTFMTSNTHTNPLFDALIATGVTTLMLVVGFALFEPTTLFGQSATDEFVVSQEIGAEISFLVNAADITMDTTLSGITGGVRLHSVAINTNNSTGYTLDISFEDLNAMTHSNGTDFISNYATTTPDYDMVVPDGESGFAYTASSASAVSALQDNGTSCGSGTDLATVGSCSLIRVSISPSSTEGQQLTPVVKQPTLRFE